MAINFPDSPVNGSTYDYQGIRYTYVVTGSTGYWRVITAGNTGSATVAEIDAGLIDNKYATPLNLEGSKYEAGLHADGVSYDNSDGALDATAATVQAAIRAVLEERPNPNLLINGGFDVWQRGVNLPSLVAEYGADRWAIGSGVQHMARSSDVPANKGYSYSCEVTGTGGQHPQIRQPVELTATGESAPLQLNTPYTISFWAKGVAGSACKVAIVWGQGLFAGDLIEPQVTLGQHDGTWKKFSHTFTITNAPNPDATALLPILSLSDMSDSVAFVTGVKLEKGSIATDFEYRPIAEELALCQRYYFDTRLDAIAPVTLTALQTAQPLRFFTNFQFPTPMRVRPTVAMYATVDGPAGYIGVHNDTSTTLTVDSLTGVSRFGAPQRANVSGTVQSDVYVAHISADAEL